MQHLSIFSSLLAQLEHHKEVSQSFSKLDDSSVRVENLEKSLSLIPEHKGVHFLGTAQRYAKVLEQFTFVSLVCRRKVDAINLLIYFATETHNAIALAQGARSLVEHVAVQAAIERALNQFSKEIKGQTESIKIHEAMTKAEAFLSRCYSGKSPKVEGNKAKQALHIHDCIDTLDGKSPGLSDAYDFLCEFVHPNYGSNSLVSSADVNNQVTSVVTDMSRPETLRMATVVIDSLKASKELERSGYESIFLLSSYERRFIEPNSKVSNIFAVRKIKPVGDGKTKETAFFFPGTRDADESFDLWAQYLKNRKITVRSRRLVGYEGNSAYDLYETAQGQLWHRIEYSIIEDCESSGE